MDCRCGFCFGSRLLRHAQDSTVRSELKRGDLTGTNMEVVIGISETKPGDTLFRHFHHGEEALYILEGATAELPDGKQISLPTGVAAINVREVPHAGFKIVGDKTLKGTSKNSGLPEFVRV
jgi:uncharacterized cupin superfamily protein